METVSVVLVEVVRDVALFGVSGQPDLVTGSVGCDVDPQPLILHHVSDDVQVAHHDDETQQVHAIRLLQLEYVVFADILQFPLFQTVKNHILPCCHENSVNEQQIGFNQD